MESVDTSQGHIQHSKKGGGAIPEIVIYIAEIAENVRKIGVKSTVLELQKTYKYKSSSIINFQNNDTG